MKWHIHIALLFFLFLYAGTVRAQEGLLRKGDRAFSTMSYLEAIEYYELAFEKGASSIPHARRLAQSHWDLRNMEQAAKWYAVVASSNEAIAQDIYRHAELLRASGRFMESDEVLQIFSIMAPDDSRGWRKDSSM